MNFPPLDIKRKKCMFGKDEEPERNPYYINTSGWSFVTSDGIDCYTAPVVEYDFPLTYAAWLEDD